MSNKLRSMQPSRIVSWLDYWDGDNPIYVNERHKSLHYRLIARNFSAYLTDSNYHALDYGCGVAWFAGELVENIARLYLIDGAPTVREELRQRFANNSRLQVLGIDEIETIRDGSLDRVFVNSVLQYVSRHEAAKLFALFYRKLKRSGCLVLGDIVPCGSSALLDAAALLSFAKQGGFLLAALLGLARTWFSDYREMRSRLGLTSYTSEDLMAMLEQSGFRSERAARNIGHNQRRMTFHAYPA